MVPAASIAIKEVVDVKSFERREEVMVMAFA